jgi:hypothetical protein
MQLGNEWQSGDGRGDSDLFFVFAVVFLLLKFLYIRDSFPFSRCYLLTADFPSDSILIHFLSSSGIIESSSLFLYFHTTTSWKKLEQK